MRTCASDLIARGQLIHSHDGFLHAQLPDQAIHCGCPLLQLLPQHQALLPALVQPPAIPCQQPVPRIMPCCWCQRRQLLLCCTFMRVPDIWVTSSLTAAPRVVVSVAASALHQVAAVHIR